MDNWLYFFTFFIFLNHSKNISAFPRISSTSDSTVQQLCHTALVRGMGKICEQYYNNAERITDRVRRSELVIGGSEDEGWDAGMRILRRIPRNVVQECCRRPCNTATLRRYCSRVRVEIPRSVNEADTENEGQGTPNYSNAEEIIFEDIESSTTEISQIGLQSVTQISYPDPVPIGDNFNENIFYGQ